MTAYEYKVISAPRKGVKASGVKGAEARFANAIETVMNEYSQQGWEYVRADMLPSDERQGITSSKTIYRSVMVFRRPADMVDDISEPETKSKGFFINPFRKSGKSTDKIERAEPVVETAPEVVEADETVSEIKDTEIASADEEIPDEDDSITDQSESSSAKA